MITKFASIDFMKTKSQLKIMGLFIIIAFIMTVSMDQSLWAVLYISFGGMIISTTPFYTEQTLGDEFTRLLPAHTSSRVCGRYLYGVFFILGSVLVGELVTCIRVFMTGRIPDYWFEISVILLASTLFMNALQYLVLSLVSMKNPQILSIVRMIIPFILFFLGGGFANGIQDGTGESISVLGDVLEFFMTHTLICAGIALLTAIAFTLICCGIACVKEAAKEN